MQMYERLNDDNLTAIPRVPNDKPVIEDLGITSCEGVKLNGKYRIKSEELYILSFEKGRGRRPRPFSKLRM